MPIDTSLPGFTTVLQDTIIGPILDEVIEMFETRPIALIVLVPSVESVQVREDERSKTGYDYFNPGDLDDVLHSRTSRRGLWLDTTNLGVSETVNEILGRAPSEALV